MIFVIAGISGTCLPPGGSILIFIKDVPTLQVSPTEIFTPRDVIKPNYPKLTNGKFP